MILGIRHATVPWSSKYSVRRWQPKPTPHIFSADYAQSCGTSSCIYFGCLGNASTSPSPQEMNHNGRKYTIISTEIQWSFQGKRHHDVNNKILWKWLKLILYTLDDPCQSLQKTTITSSLSCEAYLEPAQCERAQNWMHLSRCMRNDWTLAVVGWKTVIFKMFNSSVALPVNLLSQTAD